MDDKEIFKDQPDHLRIGGALALPTEVSASNPGDAGSLGTSEIPPRENHTHPREAASTPVGSMIVQTTAVAVPTGYLACDGAAVSRATYAVLFGVIGVTYGAGNGTTTFNVPNIAGPVANTRYIIRIQV